MAIRVITFDLDNTLWDVEPALLKAEEAQQAWLRTHRPGSVEGYDHEQLWRFKQSVWRRHPQLLHHVSDMRRQMLYELQIAAGRESQSRPHFIDEPQKNVVVDLKSPAKQPSSDKPKD